MTTAPLRFVVGRRYYCRSVCDHECVWFFDVVARSARFVTLRDDAGQLTRRGVRVYRDVETVDPLGRYSMSPVLTAEKIADEPAEPTEELTPAWSPGPVLRALAGC